MMLCYNEASSRHNDVKGPEFRASEKFGRSSILTNRKETPPQILLQSTEYRLMLFNSNYISAKLAESTHFKNNIFPFIGML